MNNLENILKDETLSQEQKLQLINQFYSDYNKKLQDDLNRFLAKKWLGFALELGSAAIPFGGAGKTGALIGENILKQTIGKKLAQEIGSGAVSGMAGGAMFGTGRSFLEDEPLFQAIICDALGGLTLGAGLGAGGAILEKSLKGNNLKNYGIDDIFRQDYQNYKTLAQDYYKNYIQGRTINHKELGNIDLTRKGLDETLSKNPKQGTIFPDMVEHLKNADFFETNQLYKARKDNATKRFHVLKDKNNKYYIAEDKQGNKKFYLAKSTTADQGTPSWEEGTSSGGSALGSSPAYSHQKRAHELEPNNIIPNSAEDFNPAQLAIPPLILSQLKIFNLNKNKSTAKSGLPSREEGALISSGGTASDLTNRNAGQNLPLDIIPNSAEDFNPAQLAIPPLILSQLEIFKDEAPTAMFNLGIEMNVDAEGNEILRKQEPDRIFTREEIGKMSTEEFTKNEKAIFAQLQNIGIPEGENKPQNSERKTKASSKSKSTAETPPGKHWVTINGNHVLLDN